MTLTRSLRLRVPAMIPLALCLAGPVGSSPANAAGLHPELDFAVSGLVGLGNFASASNFGYGGDAALQVVPDS